MLVKFLAVQCCNSLYFLRCDITLAKWAASVNHEPLPDAGRVEIVPNVAWQGCHHGVFIEID